MSQDAHRSLRAVFVFQSEEQEKITEKPAPDIGEVLRNEKPTQHKYVERERAASAQGGPVGPGAVMLATTNKKAYTYTVLSSLP